jgi:hypothetical protein
VNMLLLCLAVAGLSSGPALELGPQAAGYAGAGPTDVEDTLHYDAEPDRGASINGTYEYAGGVRHTAPESLLVKAILFYLTEPANMATVYVRDAGSSTQPGPILDSFRTNSGGNLVWKRAELAVPRQVPAGRDFWTCVKVQHASGMHPLTLDLGPMVPERGGFIQLPMIGQTWYQLTEPPFWTDRNWNIRAVVEYTATGMEEAMNGERGTMNAGPTIVRGVVRLSSDECRMSSAELLDAAGRRVMALRPGPNNVRHLAPGVYFVRAAGEKPMANRKVTIQK